MPAVLLRLFSTQETSIQSNMINDERGKELKKTLGISGKPALSVTELEKRLLQPSISQETKKTPVLNNDNFPTSASISVKIYIYFFKYMFELSRVKYKHQHHLVKRQIHIPLV